MIITRFIEPDQVLKVSVDKDNNTGFFVIMFSENEEVENIVEQIKQMNKSEKPMDIIVKNNKDTKNEI